MEGWGGDKGGRETQVGMMGQIYFIAGTEDTDLVSMTNDRGNSHTHLNIFWSN
jgi:hypothetical protein